MGEYVEKMSFYRELLWSFIYNYTRKSGILIKLIIAFCGSLFLLISGEIRISLPFTPIPITGQTLALFLLSILLGAQTGFLSGIIYLFLLGIRWGFEVFIGPTVGYLVGFPIALFFVGYLFDNFKKAKKTFYFFLILILANFFIIHVLGIIGLTIYFKTLNLFNLILMGSLPFIPGDLLKIFLVGFLVKLIYPSEIRSYDKT